MNRKTIKPNDKFGKLTTIYPTDKRYYGNVIWKCVCECGNSAEVKSTHLTHGHTKSCGCEKGYKLKDGQAFTNRLFYSYKSNAVKRGILFNLSIQEFGILINGDCFYCGKHPDMMFRRKYNQNGKYKYNGIDRVDNSVGYVPNNCVSCCKKCNAAKKSVTIEIARKIIKFVEEKSG